MKPFAFLFFLLFGWSSALFGQSIDTTLMVGRIDSMLRKANDLRRAGRMDEARTLCQTGRALAVQYLGKEHLQYAAATNLLGIFHVSKNDFEEAEALFSEALAIRKRLLGVNHIDVAGSLVNMGIAFRGTNRLKEAEEVLLEARHIFENGVKNTNHPFYANCLFHLSEMYYLSGRYQEAIELYHVRLVRLDKAKRANTPEYADIHGYIGECLFYLGRYEEALEYYQQAIRMLENQGLRNSGVYLHARERTCIIFAEQRNRGVTDSCFQETIALFQQVHGPNHGEVGRLKVIYGRQLRALGDLEAAETQLLEAAGIVENAYGPHSALLGEAFTLLGVVYDESFRFDLAEKFYMKSLEVTAALEGEDSPTYAITLDNLSNTLLGLGNYDKAAAMKEKCVAIMRKTSAPDNPDFIRLLVNLSKTYRDIGQLEKARPLMEEAVQLHQQAARKDIQNACMVLIEQGVSAYYDRQLNASLEFLQDGMDTIQHYYGKNHYLYQTFAPELLRVKIALKDYAGAKMLIDELSVSMPALLGKFNQNYIEFLSFSYDYYLAAQSYESLNPLTQETFVVFKKVFEKAAQHLSEKELSDLYNSFQKYSDQIFAFTNLRLGKEKASPCPTCLDLALFNKGFLLNADIKLRHLSFQDTASSRIYRQLLNVKRKLSAQYARPAAEQQQVEELEATVERLEKNLASRTPGYQNAFREVGWEETQRALPPATGIVEWIHFNCRNAQAADSVVYAAIVLTPTLQSPLLISLFDQKQLDTLLHASGERRADYVNHLYTYAERGVKPLGKPQKTLYDLLWKPLEPHLAGVKTVYYSPSGLLHRLNLGAVPIGLDSVLADRYRLIELGSARQLVVPAQVNVAGNTALLFGGIRYDADSTAIIRANAALDSIRYAARGELSFADTDSTLRAGAWADLPFTEREVGNVEKTLKSAGFRSATRRGYQATEEAFKSIGAGGKPSPRVLHLATHGYFFPDPEEVRSAEYGVRSTEAPAYKISEHPMIRSGLILAGGNHAWSTGKPLQPGMEDGILTAYEISQMNLSNTELVVLSACETGLGDIQGNEGVYGLQRAFKIAGVRYLIMSLWQVPDKQTSLLMSTFYKKWLEDKMPIPDAFRAAQKELRDAGLDPYQWAGFVLVE